MDPTGSALVGHQQGNSFLEQNLKQQGSEGWLIVTLRRLAHHSSLWMTIESRDVHESAAVLGPVKH